jgi:hypothetical protein
MIEMIQNITLSLMELLAKTYNLNLILVSILKKAFQHHITHPN